MPSGNRIYRDETRHVDWDALFHDRVEPVQVADNFIARLQRGYEPLDKPILYFHGVSGQGKTTLIRRLRDIYAPLPGTRRFALAELELLDEARIKEPSEVIWLIVSALAKAGVMAPLTLCLYAVYWEEQGGGQEARIEGSPLKDYIDACKDGCEAASKFGDLMGILLDATATTFKALSAAGTIFEALRDRERQGKIEELRREKPDKWSPERRESALSEFLAIDILSHLQDYGQDVIVIAVDTIDRIDPRNSGSPKVEDELAGLAERLLLPEDLSLKGRVGFVLCGRDPLNCSVHDGADADVAWADLVESYWLHGFAEADARGFLAGPFPERWATWAKEAPDKGRAARREATGQKVKEHEEAILVAACEEPAKPTAGRRYLPYSLRLAGELIYEKGDQFKPEMLGDRSADLQQRFLRHLGDTKKRALQCLALAVRFDQELFDFLVEKQFIASFARQDFVPDIIASRAYVEELEPGVFGFHRHMDKSLLDELSADETRKVAAGSVIEALIEELSRKAGFASLADFNTETHLPPYQHAMEILTTHAKSGLLAFEPAGRWFSKLEEPFDQRTALGVRAPWLERWLTVVEKVLGPKHPAVAQLVNNLAALYDSQGRYDEAEPLYRRSLAIREQALGPVHPAVAQSLNNLAVLYRALGKGDEAEPLYRRSLGIWEKTLGHDHSDVATTLNNLAGLYQAQGRHGEAELLYQRSLGIWEKESGPNHPDVALALNNLAALYYAQGRYDEAEPLYRRSLAIREQALGPEHPAVAQSLNNLAALYNAQGRYDEAEPFYRRSLGIREALGPEHPAVAQSLNNLAALYRAEGKLDEAEPLYQRSLGIWEKVLGPDHPDVASALNNLAASYHAQGRHDEAEPLYRRSLEIREKALRPDHPDVGQSLNNLGTLHHAQGRHDEAEPLLRRSLAIREKALGPNHPDVAESLNNVAGLCYSQGSYREAEPLLRRAVGIVESALGAEHPKAVQLQANLDHVLRELGKVDEPT